LIGHTLRKDDEQPSKGASVDGILKETEEGGDQETAEDHSERSGKKLE
jgi:hypothetical protein